MPGDHHPMLGHPDQLAERLEAFRLRMGLIRSEPEAADEWTNRSAHSVQLARAVPRRRWRRRSVIAHTQRVGKR